MKNVHKIKNKKKLRILILLALVIFNLNTFILNLYDNNPTSKESTWSDKNIKMSTNHAPIHINGYISGNWSAAKAAGICTGSGTYNDPYIIENFEIDGGGSGSGIIIENSDVYFKVENCTVINSGSQSNDAGIYLYNIDNGQLINNTCSNNNNYGILLDCYNNNNTISGNTVNSNALVGIYLNYCSNNNTIFNNTCSNNRIFGIYLWYSNNNIISGNIANNNGSGIHLAYSNNNTISRNIANNNDHYGIYLYNSNKNTLKGNLMIECGVYIQGSLVETSSQNIDTTNLVNGKPLYYCINETFLKSNNFPNAGQLILVNCNDSLIVDLDISSGSLGILLSYGKNNTISNNTCSNNNFGGIKLYNSNKNTISGNTVNNNYEYGICLDHYSNNNTISGNTANNNYYGIEISNSDINTISGNTGNNNSGGIRLYYSNNNTISENTANNNSNGIYLTYSNNNTISRNIANINLAHSNNNTIYFNNLVNNTKNVYSVDSTNKWNSPEKIAYTYSNKDYTNYLGNYWDNYTGTDTDNDGIGDTPYIIEGDEKDNFPLMEPFENYLKPSADTTAPAAINDLSISNPTENSITLTWTAPGDDENTGTAAGYVVKYSMSRSINDSNWDSATTYGQSWTPLTADSIETHVVSEFSPNTQYWFAIKAYDEIPNYGNISNSPSGNTLPSEDSTPPAAVTDLSIINSTKTSITLSWTAPGDDGNIGTSTGYIIKYSTIGTINESNWEEITVNIWTKDNAVVAGNTEICKVLLLNSYTHYWFAIKAYDEVFNYANISNSPSGSTVPWWRQDIQIGDILLHRSSNPLGWVLNWTHAGIYVGNYCVVEAEKDKDGGIRSYNISDWDFPNDTYVSLLRVVSASVEQREGAAQWALDQTKRVPKPKYWLDFTGKSYDPSTESWYCSELVWAAYINQPTNNYVWWGINIDMGDEGDVPITWEPVSPDDIYNDNDTRVINGHYEHYPEVKPFLIIKTNCPVDLLIIDPDNLQRGKGIFEIPDAYYLEYDFNHDGSPDDFILIPDLKIGKYSITVIPESGALPTDTYSLIVLYGNTTITLAQNLSINDIPNEPYVIRSTSEGIYYEPPQKYDDSVKLLWIDSIILTIIITATASISVIITVIIMRKKKRNDLEKK